MRIIILLIIAGVHYSDQQLACHRVPESFCCTSRIREQCRDKCESVKCGDDFIHSLFSIDSPTSSARDGDAHIGKEFVNVDQAPPSAQPSTSFFHVTESPSQFPTLVAMTMTPFVTMSPTTYRRSTEPPYRRRTTPDPRIIRPPESLVVIGDFDEDDNSNSIDFVSSGMPPSTPPPPPHIPSVPIHMSTAEETMPRGESFGGSFRTRKEISRTTFYRRKSNPKNRIQQVRRLWCQIGFEPPHRLNCRRQNRKRRTFATTRIRINPIRGELLRRRRKLDSSPTQPGEWKVSLIPKGTIQEPNIKPVPPLRVDGKSDERFKKFYNTIDSVIDKLEFTPSTGIKLKGEKSEELHGASEKSFESTATVISSRTTVAPGTTNRVKILPFRAISSPPGQKPPVEPQCGVAPDFTPCVSTEVASRELLECCQRKNLPIGCQSLCRYDITQNEIRAAMDRGQCGIFNVAPFLECASQGKDNTECCQKRGIVLKTGPQCEQFCRPTKGLTALGIQHIICGNAVGDMLHCHHSGIRL